jgi:hypothetical protein
MTDKDWYIQVVTLRTQTDLKYRSVVKGNGNINFYVFYVPNFDMLI